MNPTANRGVHLGGSRGFKIFLELCVCIKYLKLVDPCCGSGGMFIQSTDLIRAKKGDISRINIYGQEKEPATYRLAKMNLALRGLSHNLGGMADSSFTHDLHRGIYFDYIMANPPFNLKSWWDDDLESDPRWTDYATPPASNANYAWILHILSHLKPLDGVAGFLLANSALNDEDSQDIRQKLIENDKVEAITKSSFADWLNNQIIRDQLKFDIKICLIKNGYPPQYSPDVFRQVMEQVENFKENN